MAAADHREQLLQLVQKQGSRVSLSGVAGIALADLLLDLSRTKSIVFVAQNKTAAEDLRRDLRFLVGEQEKQEILMLPAHERTPYHGSSPDPIIVMERAATLYRISIGAMFRVLILTPESFISRGLPFTQLQEMGAWIASGDEIDRDNLIENLSAHGYTRVSLVEDPGTFSVRGGIIDIYWPGLAYPFRIDLFGDCVDQISYFNPSTQRTVGHTDEVHFGPAREICLDEASCGRAKSHLRDLADELDFPSRKLREHMRDLDNRIPFFGIESLMPAFFDSLEHPLELLEKALGADELLLMFDHKDLVKTCADDVWTDYAQQYHQVISQESLAFPVSSFLVPIEEAFSQADNFTTIQHQKLIVESGKSHGVPLVIEAASTHSIRQDILRESMRKDESGTTHHLMSPLANCIRRYRKNGQLVFLPVSSLGGVERLQELLRPHHLEIRHLKDPPDLSQEDLVDDLRVPSIHAYTYVARPHPPAQGGEIPHRNLVLICEDEIFGKRARRQNHGSGQKKGFKTTLADLHEGDPIVHVEHGIGIFCGLTRLQVRGSEQDFVLLKYAGDDKLYLPVHRINLIQRYVAPGGKAPRADKLGGTSWQTTRKKVKKAVMEMAQELLLLYAKREVATREACQSPDENFWEFESEFQFEATTDQQQAIDDVLQDMQQEYPMDRLICGDVGYGKTEVGMRAAMLATLSGKQVAVLAPTTVLAQQHYFTFSKRFEGTAAQIEVISRFRSTAEVRKILERTKEGKVDILIGTHRMLSNDVFFKNLGFIMVDEEQRFGVKAKEQLKRLKANVDVLTLTATPIPRTLQMSFFGVRDLSVIETPPVDRRAIRTSIMRFDDEVIREAMLRELSRGGQVYFVHNRVRSIQTLADYLKRLVPEARIGIGHGQMDERELEKIMVQFINKEINVLVCTTIIETGIDVPSANTMFIDHADDFGLAQLYQLRGRIGRSKERAFAYLLLKNSTEHITPDARKRLEVLQRFSELGAGFKIAQHDLELRGAGDLLGKGQHGHATAVGYDLYSELLMEAVGQLKGTDASEVPDPDIQLSVAAFIPEDYIPNMHDRLGMYQRLATAQEPADAYDLLGEMQERYGNPPAEVTTLTDVMVLKQDLRQICARGLEVGSPAPSPAKDNPSQPNQNPPRLVLSLGQTAKIDPEKLTQLIESQSGALKLTPQMKLIYTPDLAKWRESNEDLIALCRAFIREVTQETETSG
jgi:transcription-repair coupling factor (superfamily II helicase)